MTTDMRSERISGDVRLPQIGGLHARLVALLSSGCATRLDLSDVGAVDVSFVQLIVSASATARETGRPLVVTGVSPTLRAAFETAGVALDSLAVGIERH